MILLFAAGLLLGPPQAAESDRPSSTIIGVGNQSCATAKVDNGESLGYWTLGFWSGLQATSDNPITTQLTASKIVGDVNKLCDADPDLRISEAVLRTYVRYSKAP